MKNRNAKRLLLGLILLAVSLTAFARGKSDKPSDSKESDRPKAAAPKSPQRQAQPLAAVQNNNPQPPPTSSEKSPQTAPPSNAKMAPTRAALPRTAPPAAKPDRSIKRTAAPAPSVPTRTPQKFSNAESAQKPTRSSKQSASKPAENNKEDRGVRPADPKNTRPTRTEHQTAAEPKAQTDSSPAPSSRSRLRISTQRHVLVAKSAAARTKRTEPPAADKDRKPSSQKTEIAEPTSTPNPASAPRSADPKNTKADSDRKRDSAGAFLSAGSSRRIIVSKINRSDSLESRRKTDPPVPSKPIAQPQPQRSTLIRAADLSEPSRDRLDSSRGRPHTSFRSHRDRYDGRVSITAEKKIVLVGDITPKRPRPYIPRRLHTDLVIVRSSPRWHDCGSYFSLTFSLNSCARLACVPYGTYWGLTYYYPRYHRRYVFVSIGGWWPYEYRYIRYYWYGCHPYYWYGPTVITPAPVIEQNTYNTYNYYGTASPQTEQNKTSAWKYPFGDSNYDVSGYIQKISAPDAPQFQTAADLCFDRAVQLFLAGKYTDAAAQFREAVRLSPDDIILPFPYSQALFADGDYAHAAAVLRSAMAAVPDDQLTIYFPRGLYEKEETLLQQIEALEKTAQTEPFAADFHLLLGYQYIGIEQYDKAAEHLNEAAKDPANQPAAKKLLDLLTQLKEQPEEKETEDEP
jgi:hypothetical protein